MICRVGKDLWWDIHPLITTDGVNKYRAIWEEEGFRVHTSNRGFHMDGCFCVVNPGCIVSLCDIQNYKEEFPGWDVLYVPDQPWKTVSPFLKMKHKMDFL